MGFRIFVEGLVKCRAQIGSVQGPYVASRISLGSEQAQDQPEAGKKPKCGLSSRLQGLEEVQTPAGFLSGQQMWAKECCWCHAQGQGPA